MEERQAQDDYQNKKKVDPLKQDMENTLKDLNQRAENFNVEQESMTI